MQLLQATESIGCPDLESFGLSPAATKHVGSFINDCMTKTPFSHIKILILIR